MLSLPFFANLKPPNAFVYVPTMSECFGQDSSEGSDRIIDLSALSPLFLQFLAWKNLTQINREIKDLMTSPQNSDVNKENVLGLLRKASSHTTISLQRNTISKNKHV